MAGLAACIALRIQYPSTRIIVFDSRPKPRCNTNTDDHVLSNNDSSQGHGMILLPNAMYALQLLGAKDNIVQSCNCIKTTRVIDGTCEDIYRLQDNVETPAEEMYCCTREALILSLSTVLFSNIHPSSLDEQVEILFDMKCVHIQRSDDNQYIVQLSFSNNTQFEIAQDDLVIGADGVGSLLFRAMNPTALHRPLSRVFEVVTSTVAPSLAQKLGSCFYKVVLRRQGLAMGLLSPTDDIVIGFIQYDTERYPTPSNKSDCRKLFFSCVDQVQSCDRSLFSQYCNQLNENSAHVWRPVNADLPIVMNLNNAVLIGDAAHPLLPFTSQGVATALEDAIILSDCLRDTLNRPHTMHSTLSHFVSLRRKEVQRIVDHGRVMLDNFVHGDNKTIELPYVRTSSSVQYDSGLCLKVL